MKTAREIAEAIVAWTKIKIRVSRKEDKSPYFSEREVWWVHLGANIGHEQNGK